MSRRQPGDWACPRCSTNNFRRRSRCYGCDYDRIYKVVTRKPGDWDCPQCQTHNFASRDHCYGCSIPRKAITDVKAENETEACVICTDNKKILSFQPCGHVACCNQCGKDCMLCPLCRQSIAQRVRVFV